jgi:HEPN superfamily protein
MEGLKQTPISPRQRELQARRSEKPDPSKASNDPSVSDDFPAPNAPNAPEQSERSDPEEVDMSATTLARPPVSTAARMLLERSRAGLLQSLDARGCAERYVTAHLAALRAAAAVLAVRSRPGGRGGPRSVWEILPRVAPELGEWASFFASTASRRAAIEAGRTDVVSPREADDLLRDAEAFHHLVESSLGLPYQQVLPMTLPICD